MGITIIPNQPVIFVDTNTPGDCKCMGQCFSQLINKEDETQFQILSDDLVNNGDFANNLNGWSVYLGVSATAIVTNESATDECDGEVTITASGGTPGYTYSIDGITFQGSNIFTGLCSGHYTVIIKDSISRQGSVEFDITVNVDCGSIGCEESDLFSHDEATLFNCDENDFFCRSGVLVGFNTLTASADDSADAIQANWVDNSGTGNALAGDKVFITWHNQTQDYWVTGDTGNIRSQALTIVSDALMVSGDKIHIWLTLKKADLALISNPEHKYTVVVS